MINIIIASDIKILCEGLGQLLGQQDGISIVEFTDSVESGTAALNRLTPDILLLDMTMPSSGELIKQMHRAGAKTKIVALTVSYRESDIMQCAEAGVTCYIPREASITELVKAIRDAVKGEYYCPPKIIECMLKKLTKAGPSSRIYQSQVDQNKTTFDENQPDLYQFAKLTSREQQIVSLLTKGLSNKKIAQNLCIELSTVKNHVHNILVKLEVKNRNQAITLLKYAVRGYDSMDESLILN